MTPVYGTDYMVRSWNPEEDRSFVFKTWLGCAERSKTRDHATYANDLDFNVWHSAAIAQCVSRCEVAVIVHKDAPDLILGWAAWAPGKRPVLHYVFVREAYREQGVGTALLEATLGLGWKAKIVVYTHKMSRLARSAKGTVPAIPPGWVHSIYPFFLP